MTGRGHGAYSSSKGMKNMADTGKGTNYARLALGAGILAAAAIGVAAFVPRP